MNAGLARKGARNGEACIHSSRPVFGTNVARFAEILFVIDEISSQRALASEPHPAHAEPQAPHGTAPRPHSTLSFFRTHHRPLATNRAREWDDTSADSAVRTSETSNRSMNMVVLRTERRRRAMLARRIT